MAPKTVFSDFRLLFEVIFGALFGHFGDVGATYFWDGVRDRFGTVFSSIFEVFWIVFGKIFGINLEVFFMKNAVLPAWELIFQKFRCISLFFFVGGHFKNGSFTCMGAHCSRIFLKSR